MLAGLALFGLIGLYGSLIRIYEPRPEYTNGSVQLRMCHLVRTLASYTLGLLAALAVILLSLLLPKRIIHIADALFAGCIKSTHWLAILWLVRLHYGQVYGFSLTDADTRNTMGNYTHDLDLCCCRKCLVQSECPCLFRSAADSRPLPGRHIGAVPNHQLIAQDFSRPIHIVHLRHVA